MNLSITPLVNLTFPLWFVLIENFQTEYIYKFAFGITLRRLKTSLKI